MLPNRREVAGSIGLARANPDWERSGAVSSLTTGALVLSSMEGITQQGRGKTRRVPPWTRSTDAFPLPTHCSRPQSILWTNLY